VNKKANAKIGSNDNPKDEPKQRPGESGIYNRISVLRAEHGVTRQQLADALNINYQTIGFLERGDYSPSLKLAFGLSEFFNLPVEAIFSTKPFQPLSEQVYGTRVLQRNTAEPKRDSE
jgi:putative transcriptional regulator